MAFGNQLLASAAAIPTIPLYMNLQRYGVCGSPDPYSGTMWSYYEQYDSATSTWINLGGIVIYNAEGTYYKTATIDVPEGVLCRCRAGRAYGAANNGGQHRFYVNESKVVTTPFPTLGDWTYQQYQLYHQARINFACPSSPADVEWFLHFIL